VITRGGTQPPIFRGRTRRNLAGTTKRGRDQIYRSTCDLSRKESLAWSLHFAGNASCRQDECRADPDINPCSSSRSRQRDRKARSVDSIETHRAHFGTRVSARARGIAEGIIRKPEHYFHLFYTREKGQRERERAKVFSIKQDLQRARHNCPLT
jgi:hypothetical protein